MGTRFEIVLCGDDARRLRSAGEAALERIGEAHRTFSRFDSDSLIAHLRRTAPSRIPVDRDSLALFSSVEQVRRGSGGAFNLFCHQPSGAEHPAIDITHGTIGFGSASWDPDFGGCAKGFAIDWAVTVLRDAGVSQAFLQGGTSSVYALGAPPDVPGWRVALGPRSDDPVVCLRDEALACSATMVPREGRTTRHLVDPRTGQSVTVDRRVVITGPTAGPADAWSTATAVLGHRPAGLTDEWTLWMHEETTGWRTLTTAA